MNEPMGDHEPDGGMSRKSIVSLLFGVAMFVASPASAGVIHHHHVVHESSRARLQASAVNPWGAYWQDALQNHRMHVTGPKALSILSLSAVGTLPTSPFVQYLDGDKASTPRFSTRITPTSPRSSRGSRTRRLWPRPRRRPWSPEAPCRSSPGLHPRNPDHEPSGSRPSPGPRAGLRRIGPGDDRRGDRRPQEDRQPGLEGARLRYNVIASGRTSRRESGSVSPG